MVTEAKPTLFGVGVLIIYESELAVVKETRTSKRSVKIEGQQTFPMETVEEFDEDDYATIKRACSEEIAVSDGGVRVIIPLNIIETRPGVQLRNYAVEVSSKDAVRRGSFVDEVSDIEWISLEEVVRFKGKLRFRPGVYEAVNDYRWMRMSPENYRLKKYNSLELADKIPADVFNWVLDEGLSGIEAVSRWNVLQQPQ